MIIAPFLLFFSGGFFPVMGDITEGGIKESSALNNTLPEYAPGFVLVKNSFGGNASANVLATAHATIGATVVRDYSSDGIPGLELVNIPDSMPVNEAVSYYQGVPGVTYVEPDYYRYPFSIPSDPEFWRQWGLENTGQVFRENFTAGKAGADIQVASAWNSITGGESIVAVIDSGVDYRHPDLTSNIWVDQATGTKGYDTLTGSLDPMDQLGHGTHCAGIIGAVANNGIGGSGVNWNASIMPVRFIDSANRGRISDEISAISWATTHGAKILSCSFGNNYPSISEKEMIEVSDALFIIAAGNDNTDLNIHPEYPAAYNLSNMITVAAITPNDTLTDFSNYGKGIVYLGAPGEEIYSTVRSRYEPDPVWYDPFHTFENWTAENWTLDNQSFVSYPYSARGTNAHEQEVMTLTLNRTIDLKNLTSPVISYQVTTPGMYAGLRLEGKGRSDRVWHLIDSTLSFWDSGFVQKQAQIPVELQGEEIIIRFVVGEGREVLLDDIMISEGYGTLIKPEWSYYNGTSMATPMVAGAACLLSNYAPEAHWKDIRSAILNSCDPLPDLTGKTITGGRLNITAAIQTINQNITPDIIAVAPGWNHVSVPKRLKSGSDTVETVFGQLINTSGHSVLHYINNTWVTVGEHELVSPLSSYWLYSASPQILTYLADPVQTGVYTTSLKNGWNGFGIVGLDNLSAKDQLSPVGENWSYAIGYNPMNQVYEEPIIRNGTGNQSDLRPLIPAQGYWLYMAEDSMYSRKIS